jgi:CoA:oxalate CoA-transferase
LLPEESTVSGDESSIVSSLADGSKPAILHGIRVLDLSRFLSGPQATLFLAGMGAEVIKIDEPSGGDPTFAAPPYFGPGGVALDRRSEQDLGIAYLKRARGKKSIALDLKSAEGRDILLRIVREADVLVENFKAGVTSRLQIDYDVLRVVNPRLVYCSITGYGSTGPERHRKAFDLMVQAATGMMSITGDPTGLPSKTGASLSDGIAGTFALAGILGALYQRHETGLGQFVDVSMADCLVSLIFDEPFECYRDLGLAHQHLSHRRRIGRHWSRDFRRLGEASEDHGASPQSALPVGGGSAGRWFPAEIQRGRRGSRPARSDAARA